jgi:hypothetical protein
MIDGAAQVARRRQGAPVWQRARAERLDAGGIWFTQMKSEQRKDQVDLLWMINCGLYELNCEIAGFGLIVIMGGCENREMEE